MLPAAQKRRQFGALGLAELNPITYIHLCLLIDRGTDEQLNRMAGVSRSGKTFTPKQGQYLAFIHLYTRLHRRPPAETDMQQYFRVSPPSVHQMVLPWNGFPPVRFPARHASGLFLLHYADVIEATMATALARSDAPQGRAGWPRAGRVLTDTRPTGATRALCGSTPALFG